MPATVQSDPIGVAQIGGSRDPITQTPFIRMLIRPGRGRYLSLRSHRSHL